MKKVKKTRKKHEKCIKCKIIPCVNLYRKINKLEGGEIYLFEQTIKEKLHLPCESGSLVYAICKFSVPLVDTLSFELFNQCIRDLKTVTFLLLTGHYRSSMQIMRPIIENWLTGLYWDVKFIRSNRKKEIEKEYHEFINVDKYIIPEKDRKEAFGDKKKWKKYIDQEFLLQWLFKKRIFTDKFKNNIQKEIGKLNNYLHPSYISTDFSRNCWTGCSSAVKFNEKEYMRAIKIFQEIVTYLCKTFYTYIATFSPKKMKTEDVKEAIDTIKGIPETENAIGRRIIFSNALKEFINELKNPKGGNLLSK